MSKTLAADATEVKACLYAGGRTRTYEVLSRACGDRDDYCTAFVAVPLSEDMAFAIYDVGRPPFAVAEDDECGSPEATLVR